MIIIYDIIWYGKNKFDDLLRNNKGMRNSLSGKCDADNDDDDDDDDGGDDEVMVMMIVVIVLT